jgi:hypothetical protein
LLAIGITGGGSIGLFGAVEGSAGAAIDHGNVVGLANGNISAGIQASASAGASIIVAPFISDASNLTGGSFDLHLRLGFPVTISVPINLDIRGLAVTVGIKPGIEIGVGAGMGITGTVDIYRRTPCK